MKTLIEQMSGYRTEVRITLFANKYANAHNGVDVDSEEKVYVEFQIEQEFRSWGIKDIEISFSKSVKVNIWDYDEDMNEVNEREIEVDLSKAQIDWTEGSGYAPYELEITLDAEGKVAESTVNCYYIAKGM